MHVILKSVNFKINSIVIFNITSTDFVLMSADVILKMTIGLSQLRIAKLNLKMDRLYVQKGLNPIVHHTFVC